MKKFVIQLTVISLLIAVYAQVVSAGPAPVQSITYQKDCRTERVVIAVSGDISWKSAVLGKGADSGAYRLYIDISGSQPSRNALKPAQPASSLIENIRVAPRDTATTRVVLELAAPLDTKSYTVSRTPDSKALVVNIPLAEVLTEKPPAVAKASAPAHQKSSGQKKLQLLPFGNEAYKKAVDSSPPPAALSTTTRTADGVDSPEKNIQGLSAPGSLFPPAPKAVVSGRQSSAPEEPSDSPPCVIVIDPGHGGKDPGAMGYGGVEEKNISLAIALELKKILDADSRCRVIMTRSTDTFVSLEERAAIANRNKANLFISIHANANEDSMQKGTETYYLDFSSDVDARRVAARENFTTPEAIGDLELILFDLLQSDKINQSSILAGYVHNALMSRLKSKYPDTRNLGIKHAPMKVLVDAEMPCLILETAFLSNPVEAQRLQKTEHQKLLAQAITDGIGSYLRSAGTAAHPRSSLAGM